MDAFHRWITNVDPNNGIAREESRNQGRARERKMKKGIHNKFKFNISTRYMPNMDDGSQPADMCVRIIFMCQLKEHFERCCMNAVGSNCLWIQLFVKCDHLFHQFALLVALGGSNCATNYSPLDTPFNGRRNRFQMWVTLTSSRAQLIVDLIPLDLFAASHRRQFLFSTLPIDTWKLSTTLSKLLPRIIDVAWRGQEVEIVPKI